MTEPPHAVYDCMIVLKAALRPDRVHGTIRLVQTGAVRLRVSPAVVAEVRDVLTRPKLQARYPALTSDRASQFVDAVFAHAHLVRDVPAVFRLPRDPKGEPQINLAIASEPCHLVTWNDRHLTYLMRRDTPEGLDFCERHPGVRIVSPPEFVRHVRQNQPGVGDEP